jgi:hypothetical protein
MRLVFHLQIYKKAPRTVVLDFSNPCSIPSEFNPLATNLTTMSGRLVDALPVGDYAIMFSNQYVTAGSSQDEPITLSGSTKNDPSDNQTVSLSF